MPISNERIERYKVETILIIVIIVALFISIDINMTLINIGKEGRDPTVQEQQTIKKKAEFISLVYVIASLYFAYSAYLDYKESRTKSNYYFFLATIILVVAALIREYWINQTENFEGGAEDYAL